MSVEVVSIIVVIVIIVVTDNWLIMVDSVWVGPVESTSVPCVVRGLMDWLLNIESSVVVSVISVVVVAVWDGEDLCSMVVAVAMVEIVIVGMVSRVINNIIVNIVVTNWVEVLRVVGVVVW